MKNDDNHPVVSLASLLYPISLAYGGAMNLRSTLYRKGILKIKRLPCKVISIGNITVGGTGKTPMTIYVAELVRRLGYEVAVISRGYKGGSETTGGIVSNGRTIFMHARAAGDEPYLMAKTLDHVPVLVGKNRYDTGMLAKREFDPEVIVLDDAFQHMPLFRDIDIVLLDYQHPFGNHYLLPRGVLREPISSLRRGDAFVLTRTVDSESDTAAHRWISMRKKPLFRAIHIPYVHGPVQAVSELKNRDCLKGRRVYAFSAIAGNSNFRQTIKTLGCDVIGYSEFPNHYGYSIKDLNQIGILAKAAKADVIMTTEKDYVRIGQGVVWPVELAVVGIRISLRDEKKAFDEFIKKRLADAS